MVAKQKSVEVVEEEQEMSAEEIAQQAAYERVMHGEGLDEWFALLEEARLDSAQVCADRDPKDPNGWIFSVDPF